MQPDTHGGNLAATLEKLGLDDAPPLRLDFSVNLNPLGPCDAVDKFLLNAGHAVSDYPDIAALPAENAIASACGLPLSNIIACSGATEAFELVLRAVNPSSVAWTPPSYSGYQEICGKLAIPDLPVPSLERNLNFNPDFKALKASRAGLVFLCSPSNPSGQTIAPKHILELADALPESVIVVDESFMDFTGRATELSLLKHGVPENLVVIKSLTKFHCIAGLRLVSPMAAERSLRR